MSDPTGTAGASRRTNGGSRARIEDALRQHERALSAAVTALQMAQKTVADLRQALAED